MARSEIVDALLLDLPVATWAASNEHYGRLLAVTDPGPALAAFQALAGQVRGSWGEISAPTNVDLHAAAERHVVAPLDIAFPVPRSARADVVALLDGFDAVDAESASGRPDLVAPAEVAAFRRWFLGELVRQIDGGIPAPWKG